MAMRVHRRCWYFAAPVIFAGAIAACLIRAQHKVQSPRTTQVLPYWDTADNEMLKYLRLRDEYDRRLKELEAAGELEAWTIAAPERQKMEEQRERWGRAYDTAERLSK